MENLTRTQVIFLVLLVSFMVSVATGIVTVTLMNQAPPPLTQSINRIIEKVIPGETPQVQQIISDTREEMVTSVVKNVSPAVVSVIATKDVPVFEEYYTSPFGNDEFFNHFFGGIQVPQYRQKGTEKKQVSSGTGFFVSADGLIITNKHVVQDAEAEYTIIKNDGGRLSAKVLARDSFQDIAVLKVEGKDFNYIPLGDSSKIEIGQTAIAIGNSLGEFQNTVSVGIVSGLNRSITASGAGIGTENLQGLIQTDAAINAGNSGGPLLNLSGQAIGINTAMASDAENMGFALPINIAKRDIQDAKDFGKIKYPYLGVRYKVTDQGVVLTKGQNGETAVYPDSPAAKAGLKEGDIIKDDLSALLSQHRVGDKVDLNIIRDGKEMTVSLTLEERPENL